MHCKPQKHCNIQSHLLFAIGALHRLRRGGTWHNIITIILQLLIEIMLVIDFNYDDNGNEDDESYDDESSSSLPISWFLPLSFLLIYFRVQFY